MDTFDYIIVGAGSAGCVLANRLSADPGNRVLLVEAGGKADNFLVRMPAGFSKLLNHPRFNWNFQSEPEENTGNRSIPIPRGKGIGGSTAINGMLYVRGQAADYDQWAQLGNRGWSFDDVLPYFRKSERFERGGNGIRGTEGPVSVSDMRERHDIIDAFIDAGVECGFERNPDYNGARQDGFGYYQVMQRNGQRVSAADAYLTPARNRANLQVVPNAHVKRVLITENRANGILYDQGGTERRVLAGRSVILSAGAVQTPQLLELSGVGQPDHLRALGIEVNHALSGVGENFIDHFAARISWRVTGAITLNQQTRGVRLAGEVLKYLIARRGVLTFTAGIGHGFVRTRPDLASPDCQFLFAPASFGDASTRALDKEPGMTIAVSQLRPESTGSIHVRSADPFAAPAIRPNFLTAPIDRQVIVEGLRIARRIGEAPALARYAAHELNPGADCRDDDGLLDHARLTGSTVYHPMGTCRNGQ